MSAAEEFRPREKALESGISSLNDTELLALIIKSACRDRKVKELSEEVIEAAGGFQNLLSLSYEELVAIKGIKQAKALEILAILETAKRISRADLEERPLLDNPEKVAEYLRFAIGYSDQEEFAVLYLNSRGILIRFEILFRGNGNMSAVGIDKILRKGLLLKAQGILVAHNHPSDSAAPSNEDILMTDHLEKSAALMGLRLVDHLIVTRQGYFSFKNNGLLC